MSSDDDDGVRRVTFFRHKGCENCVGSPRARNSSSSNSGGCSGGNGIGLEGLIEAPLSRPSTVKDRSIIDPSLSENGWKELETISQYYETHPVPEIVITSPLKRSLQTSTVFKSLNTKIIAEELCRSSFTAALSNKRSPISEIKLQFDFVDFSNCFYDEDNLYQTENRSLWKSKVLAVRERANRFLTYLEELPRKEIAVISHSSFIRNLLAQVIGLNDNHDVLIEDVVSIIFLPDRGWELLESAIIIKLKPDKS
jgi:broad specificity phosphatase PhoE